MFSAGGEGVRARGERPAGFVSPSDAGTPRLVGVVPAAASGRQHSPRRAALGRRPRWCRARPGTATARDAPRESYRGPCPPSPLVGSRPRRGTRSRTGRGAPGAKSQARGVLPPLVASRTQGGRWSGSPSPSPPLPQSQRDPGSSRTACGGLPRTPLCVQPSIPGVGAGGVSARSLPVGSALQSPCAAVPSGRGARRGVGVGGGGRRPPNGPRP